MSPRTICVASFLSLCLVSTGCSSADYRGANPSVRSFQDVPRQPRDVYLGMDWTFSLDRPRAYHSFADLTSTASTPAQSAVSTTAGE
jgi:hypothetical protein